MNSLGTNRRPCTSCGFSNRPVARYCGWCGTRLADLLSESASPEPLAPGTWLGPGQRYRVDHMLGHGGFGEVYLLEDTHLSRLCVAKRLTFTAGSPAQVRQALAAFAHEARLLVALSQPGHPNIPEVFEYLPEDRCLVMKYVTGKDLWRLAKSRPDPLPEAEALRYARDVCSALAYMHSHTPEPVLHGDLKPQNIMLDEIGRVWLIDFGLARRVVAAHLHGNDAPALASGTPGYTPPEQWDGAAEPRSDVYALGATLYTLLTGQRPPSEPGPPPIAIRALNPDVRPQVDQLIARAMAINIRERPGAAALLAELDELLSSVDAPPPPEPAAPPQTLNFVGRAAELAELTRQLATQQIAIITGMPGIGKTTLAARLAHHVATPARIFWYSFRADDSVETLIWQLAGWLAQRGRGWAWKHLQQMQQQIGQLPSPELFAEQLIQLATGQEYLLCLDDLHLIEANPQIKQVLERLIRAAHAGKLALILTSRAAISVVADGSPVLGGLTLADTAALFREQEIEIGPELLGTLHTATEGNPEFLVLAAALLQRAVDPGSLITRLIASEAIEQYLLEEVDAGLSEAERTTMEAVAVLLGYGGSRHAIEALAEGLSLRRVLAGLVRRNLLTVERRGEEPIYHQHAIVQRFYYELPSQRGRKVLHGRAGAYYEADAQAPLLAARHYLLANDHGRAAAMIGRDPWRLIQQGHARAISSLLADLPLTSLSQPIRADVHTAQAEAAALLGNYVDARAAIELAIGEGDDGDTLGKVRQARRLRLLAQMLDHTGDYGQAEHACRRGLALATASSGPRTETARLYMQLATILMRRSALDEAADACHAGLAALPPELAAPAERSALLQRLATIEGQRDSYVSAIEILEQSLDLARQAGDPLLMASVLHNMGVAYMALGQPERAETLYHESRQLKEEVGDIAGLIITGGALGKVFLAQGDQAAARRAFEEWYALSERHQLRARSVEALTNLGQLDFEQRNFAQARVRLTLAERIYAELGQPQGQAFCRYTLGDIELEEGAFLAALAHGRAALALARQSNRRPLEACAWRVIGEALFGQKQYDEANQALSAAWAIGEQVGDPYDQALILAARARLAYAVGDWPAALSYAQKSLNLARTHEISYVLTQMGQLIAAIDQAAAT